MAKKYIIELETKADGTIGTLNDVAKSLEAVASAEQKVAENTVDVNEQLAKLKEQLLATDTKSDQYKELSAQYEKLGGKIADLVPKTTNLKQEQRELKKALLAGQEALGTEKYTQLTQRLGEVNDQLKDIAESAGQNAGPPLENLSNISGGLTDRLKNLDFEGLSQDVRNFAGNIKNLSFKSVVDGAKGLVGAFGQLGKALLGNPIFAVAATIIAIGFAVKKFVDSEREDVAKLNAELDKGAEARKDNERLAFAQAAGNTQKITQLKLQSNALDLADTRTKIQRLTALQDTFYGLSEDQEKELSDLRDKYRQQQIDGEIIKVEAINALNAKRLSIQEEFELRNLNERQKAEALLTREYAKQEEELRRLGGTAEDFDKLGEIFANKIQELRKGFAQTDADAAKAASDKAKATADAVKSQQDAVNEAIRQAQEEFRLSSATEQERELASVAEKYRKLKEQAVKAKVDTAQIVELQGKEEQAIRDKYIKQAQTQAEQAQAEQQAAEEEAARKRQETLDKEKQQAVETENEKQQAILVAQNAGLSLRQQQLNADLAALKADYDARIELAKKYGQDITALEQEYTQKVGMIRLKAQLETAQKWAETASQITDALVQLNQAKVAELGQKLNNLDKQISEARTKQQRDELLKQRAQLEAEQKRAFERNKKAQIAAVIVNTAANAIAAFSSQITPGDPMSPIRGAVAAAAAIAAGAIQISNIKKTQFESTEPPASSNIPVPPDTAAGGGGGGGAAESTTPGFNPLVLDFLANRPEQSLVRSYVLAGDVQQATQARDRVEELARLGG